MSKLGKILIVDDDPLVLEALNQTFCDDYEVIAVESGADAIETIKQNPDLDSVVLDIKMARMDGLKTASFIKELNPDLPVIFHTGYPGDYSESDIQEQYQPFDYVGKNERPARLIRAVRNAVTFYQLKTNRADLLKLAREQFGIVGGSRAMLDVYRTIEKIGPTENKVMILGATGTGKELVARAIHKRSARADRPLVIFNCNHKAPDLVESELFGHLKGSFTGAIDDRIGLFEFADHGTMFLDEIGDLDVTTQAKILRVLETGEFSRIGSPKPIFVDVRLICATHRDLEKTISEKRFREDLYYRLKGVTIRLPALKERREDIPSLIDFFAERHCAKTDCGMKVFEPIARDCLIDYDWPGNVRQLLDTVQSLIDLSPSHYITRLDVIKYLSKVETASKAECGFSEQLKEFKRTLVLKALDRNSNNISASARELGLDPSNLRKIIQDLKVDIG